MSGLLALALVVALAPSALGEETTSYLDFFSETGYSGNDGDRDWLTSWEEFGENDGYTEGMVQSVSDAGCPEGSNCLLIEGGGLLSSIGAARYADTSDLSDLVFRYKISRYNDALLKVDSPQLSVQVTDDGGGSWTTVAQYDLDTTDSGYLDKSHDVDGWASPGFGVRFRVTDTLLETDEVGVFIDYVKIEGVPWSTTTTSSTTTSTSSTTSTTSTTTSTSSTTSTTSTTTSTSSTTSTTSTTTSTSSTTTTTEGSSDGTDLSSDTTTTTLGPSSGGDDGDDGGSSDQTIATTTTSLGDTSTTEEDVVVIPSVEPPEDPGLRQATIGLQVGYQGGRLGEIAPSPDLMGVAIQPSYTMAVEVFESTWAYLLVLLLVIATAIVSGIDRRRLKRAKHTRVGRSNLLTHGTG